MLPIDESHLGLWDHAQMVPVRLTSLTFGDGTTVPMGEGSIAILVGPNNVGKSRALRDINAQVSVQSEPPAVVVGATVEKPLEDEELDAWLRENAHIIQRGLSEVVGRPFTGEIDIGQVKALYRAGPPFQQTGPYYVFFASTEQRFNWLEAPAPSM